MRTSYRSQSPSSALSLALSDPHIAQRLNAKRLRRTAAVGSFVVGTFVIGLTGWAAIAPLASAALALGVVAPDGNRRVIQHLEGGIIRAIKVRDGDLVKRGDVLVEMDSTRDDASQDIVRVQRLSSLAALARLKAEETTEEEVSFPAEVTNVAESELAVAALVNAQISQFVSRRAQVVGQKQVLQQRAGQNLHRIAGLEKHIETTKLQLQLLDEELRNVLELLQKGLERKSRIWQLQRAKASLEGDIAKDAAEIEEAKQANQELKTQIALVDDEFQEKLARERTTVETELSAAEEKLRAINDIVTRTKIVSPVDGTVVGLRFHTLGGVVPAGAPVLEIVPSSEKLTVDIQISPADIDVVRKDQSAIVRFTAYHQLNLPRIEGRVSYVAADTTRDEKSGRAFFLGKVDVDPKRLRELAPSVNLSAGMPADVSVTTGTRTVLQYMIDPLLSSLQRSFVED